MGFWGWLLVAIVVLALIGRRHERQAAAGKSTAQSERRPMWPPVKVIKDRSEIEDGVDFRFSGDPPWIIRRSYTDKPEGFTELYRDVPLVGVSHEDRASALTRFIQGWDRELELARTPVPQDPNGIMVYGRWTDRKGRWHSAELGWLPREIAGEIAKQCAGEELRATPLVMYLPRPGKSPGMRMMIWRPYKRPQEKAQA